MYVNEKKFKTYQLDVNETILARIAKSMNTLPEYLYVTKVENKMTVQDILKDIEKDAQNNIDFLSFYETIKDKTSVKQNNILKIWLSYNKPLGDLLEYDDSVIDPFVKQKFFKTKDDFLSAWKNRKNTIADLAQEKMRNQLVVDANIKLFETFESIDEDEEWGYTETKVLKVQLSISLEIKEISILELFNNIILNENIPFAKTFSKGISYYKILKDYSPFEEWAGVSEEEKIIIMVNNNLSDEQKLDFFTSVEITKYKVDVILDTGLINISQETFLDRLMKVFVPNLKFLDITETQIIGDYYFPQQRVNMYVLSDLIMNNPIFSKLINVDESVKVTKKKKEGQQPWLHVHFDHPSTGDVSVSVSQRVVDRGEAIMRKESSEIFPHNSPYIRMHIKARDKSSVQFFQKMFAKLLYLYEKEKEQIITEYKVYLPKFGVFQEYEFKERKENMDQDVFVRNYTRYCPEDRMPTKISEDEVKKYQDEGRMVMKYPRDIPKNVPENEVFPSDGRNQQYYVCLKGEFIYPGVQENKHDNKDEYPYVPCCFKMDQSKEGSNYKKYFFNEKIQNKEKSQQQLIVTDKILSDEQYGKIPDIFSKMFQFFDPETTNTYIRVGVNRSKSSFLEAVMVALHDITGILKEKNRKAKVEQIRKELASKENSALARQCLYDISSEHISEKINNMDSYFDPKYFVQQLEVYFKCNIFVFNRTQLILPRYTQSYYKNINRENCVLIYEHIGSESDNAKYPQCEIICRWNKTNPKDTLYSFPMKHPVSSKVNSIFEKLNLTYCLNKKVQEVNVNINEMKGIVSQKIDSYGKCRCVEFSFQDKQVFMITSPIPPLQLEEKKLDLIPVDIKVALNFCNELKINIESQSVQNNICKEINGMLGNISVTIPVKDTNVLQQFRSTNDVKYSENIISSMEIYNINKKRARYITEYMFWLFSKYIRSNNIEEITDQVLASFCKNKMSVIQGYPYGHIGKNFSDSSIVLRGRKLVSSSDDMLYRLMYVLKLYSIRDVKSLREYHAKTSIVNYYVDITDFDKHPFQIVLQGDDVLYKLLHENKFSYKMENSIIVGINNPYFFTNNLIDNQVFLAQNAKNLKHAISISLIWQQKGYNIGEDTEIKEEKVSYTLFSFENEKSIKRYEVKGAEPKDQIRIIGYKVNDEPFFTSLLKL